MADTPLFGRRYIPSEKRIPRIACRAVDTAYFAHFNPDVHCRAFRDILKNAGVTANLRLKKGHDTDAACGQLRLKQ